MRNPDRQTVFRFKQFEVSNCRSAMKVGTDGVLLGAWAFEGMDASRHAKVLDVGCGTGVIALMMAQRFSNASVTGVDIDAVAAAEASENFAKSPWGIRLSAICTDFLNYAANAGKEGAFDLIVSNPPFFSNGALAPDMARRIARHEGSLELASLIDGGVRLLAPGGRMGLVLPAEQRGKLEFLAALAGLEVDRLCLVKTVDRKMPRRILCELVKEPCGSSMSGHSTEESLTLQQSDGELTDRYRELVSPFYIK